LLSLDCGGFPPVWSLQTKNSTPASECHGEHNRHDEVHFNKGPWEIVDAGGGNVAVVAVVVGGVAEETHTEVVMEFSFGMLFEGPNEIRRGRHVGRIHGNIVPFCGFANAFGDGPNDLIVRGEDGLFAVSGLIKANHNEICHSVGECISRFEFRNQRINIHSLDTALSALYYEQLRTCQTGHKDRPLFDRVEEVGKGVVQEGPSGSGVWDHQRGACCRHNILQVGERTTSGGSICGRNNRHLVSGKLWFNKKNYHFWCCFLVDLKITCKF